MSYQKNNVFQNTEKFLKATQDLTQHFSAVAQDYTYQTYALAFIAQKDPELLKQAELYAEEAMCGTVSQDEVG